MGYREAAARCRNPSSQRNEVNKGIRQREGSYKARGGKTRPGFEVPRRLVSNRPYPETAAPAPPPTPPPPSSPRVTEDWLSRFIFIIWFAVPVCVTEGPEAIHM